MHVCAGGRGTSPFPHGCQQSAACPDDDDPFIVLTETKFSILPYTCLGSVLASPDKG
jgi:hypothetical protein